MQYKPCPPTTAIGLMQYTMPTCHYYWSDAVHHAHPPLLLVCCSTPCPPATTIGLLQYKTHTSATAIGLMQYKPHPSATTIGLMQYLL